MGNFPRMSYDENELSFDTLSSPLPPRMRLKSKRISDESQGSVDGTSAEQFPTPSGSLIDGDRSDRYVYA